MALCRFPESIDLKIARIIGKNIVSVVRGESTMLEHLRVGDTLDDYYANAMGIHYTEYMARLTQQLSFKKPDLNFLEIGKYLSCSLSHFLLLLNSYRGWNWCRYQKHFQRNWQVVQNVHIHGYF